MELFFFVPDREFDKVGIEAFRLVYKGFLLEQLFFGAKRVRSYI